MKTENQHKAVNSPFRYAGGKFYARKLILEQIPEHTRYIELFAGGGSIFYAKPKVETNWLNDIDTDLMNCVRHIKREPQNIIDVVSKEIATKERHAYYKNVFKPKNPLEKAIRWFYLNRTSFSGIMNNQNCYWGYGEAYSMGPKNWGNTITRASKKLQGVKLTSWDFERLLDSLEVDENTFLFIDPPYFNADQDKFYTHSFTKDDHYRFHDCLLRNHHKFKFLLTYDNCPEIREMYNWAHEIEEKEWNYTLNRTDDQKKESKEKSKKDGKVGERYKGKEIFIRNYELEPRVMSLFGT